MLLAVDGHRFLKLTWWAVGMLLAFLFNVLRLASIILLAHAGQPSLALGGYHAVIGMVLFTIVVLVMTLALPLFGLGWWSAPAAAPKPAVSARPRMTRRTQVAVAAFVGLSLLLTVADQDLQAYASFADGTGAPTVDTFGSNPQLGQTQVIKQQTFGWTTQYFGANSDFSRWALVRPGQNVVWADVVRTDDKGTLDAFTLTNCSSFTTTTSPRRASWTLAMASPACS